MPRYTNMIEIITPEGVLDTIRVDSNASEMINPTTALIGSTYYYKDSEGKEKEATKEIDKFYAVEGRRYLGRKVPVPTPTSSVLIGLNSFYPDDNKSSELLFEAVFRGVTGSGKDYTYYRYAAKSNDPGQAFLRQRYSGRRLSLPESKWGDFVMISNHLPPDTE